MKKFYVLLVVCLSVITSATAQNYFWIGPSGGAGGAWNDGNNWSFSSGGGPAGSFPNSAAHNVTFDQNALVNVNVASINLFTLTVTNNATAKLFTATGSGILLNSTSNVNQALRINAGSRLEDSADADVNFSIALVDNGKGVVDGTWYFAGRASLINPANGATFFVPSVGTTRLDINGTLHYRPNSVTLNVDGTQNYIFFNSGSTCWLDRDFGNSPIATWHTNSTILITNVINNFPVITFGPVNEIGNLVVNVPTLTPSIFAVGMPLPADIVIKGNLQFLSTNNRIVFIGANGSVSSNNFLHTINGNLEVSGNSRIALGQASNANKVLTFQVNGNLNLSGTSFDLQVAQASNVVANPTTLRVRGNINHTAGSFGSAQATTTTNNSVDLYVLELNGTSNQTIASTVGVINMLNNDLTLLMNNAAGATLANPLTVGKLSFNSANKGRITTTSTNVLTINNSGTHSLVVNAPAATGFVNGPVRRRTTSTNDYLLPTGKGSTYDPVQFRPSASTASVYQAEYFNTAFSDLTFVTPINGVSNQEYWQANVVSGVNAALILTLTGAVPGAGAGDAVGVGRYNGADWVDYSPGGTVIVPGNSTSGSARSTTDAINGFFTFVYGVAGSLPIHLLDFDAKKISVSAAQVTWQISNNSNPEQFEVLRSSDGRNFNGIGVVKAVDLKYAYAFADNSMPSGTSYYRLKMTDKQGIVTYSQIVAIINGGGKGVILTSLMPTVVRSSATLSVSSSEKGSMQLVVTDMYGRIVKQQVAAISTGNQQVLLNLGDLPAGAYQVTGIMNSNKVGTIRFVRQ
jgi:hypothetical protein